MGRLPSAKPDTVAGVEVHVSRSRETADDAVIGNRASPLVRFRVR